jgi:thioredoxin-like negative regulator of GroEL
MPVLTSLALSLSLLASSPPPPGPWLSDLAPARAEAKRTGKPILVDLYADWCGWCKELDRDVFASPKFQDYGRHFVLLRLDTEDGGDGTMIEGRYGAESLPTILLLRHDLVEIGKVQGFAPVDNYLGRLQAELDNWATINQTYEQVASGRNTADVRALAEELHQRGDGPRAAILYRRVLSTPGLTPDLNGWTRYLLADALRMAEDYESAQREIAEAKRGASGKAGEQLIERLDLLAVQVAEDRGDCRSQVSALQSFIKLHPQSDYRYRAQRTLDTLRSEGGAQCG